MKNSRKKIIIVDDDRTYLTVARNILIDKYDVFTVPSGEKLFIFLEKLTPDLILLDIEMPQMNGYEVIKILKRKESTSNIPVIFLSALISPENEIEGLDLGAVDYILKPFSREILIKRIELHLLVESQRKELERYTSNLEGMVFEKTQTVYELQNTILKTLAELVECRDDMTGRHIERTQNYLRLLVNLLKKNRIYTKEISSWDIDLLVMSSQLHDVGKISVKDSILLKTGKLTDAEFEEMKTHTSLGRQIIEKIEKDTKESAFLEYAKILTFSHHEKWDGTGYPLGLKGEDIPLQGRLMAIVDVYDALSNDRPYKKAFSHEEALDIIKSGSGRHFDPLITETFVKYNKEFAKAVIPDDEVKVKPNVSTQLNTIFKTVSNIVELRGGSVNSHTERARSYLQIFIEALSEHDLFKEEVLSWDKEVLLMSAQLHDIGKIAVPDIVLNKTGELTNEEYTDIKSHVDFGMKIINMIRESVDGGKLLHHAEALTGSHHEKWDGTGYPKGLKGREIPLQGRIMAIVDVYDALTSNRPHRDMLNHDEAVEIIKNLKGTQFDPDLVDVFIKYEREFEKTGII